MLEVPEINTLKTEIDGFTFISTFKVYEGRFFHKKVVFHGRDIHGYLSEAEGNFYLPVLKRIEEHKEWVQYTFKRIVEEK